MSAYATFYQTNFYILLGIMAAAAFGLTLLLGRIALPHRIACPHCQKGESAP